MQEIIHTNFPIGKKEIKEKINKLSKDCKKEILILTPFLSNGILRMIDINESIKIRIIVNASKGNLLASSTDLDEIKTYFQKKNFEFRHNQRLHSKLYIFDENTAIIGSANLTNGGLENNIEIGSLTKQDEILKKFVNYFEELWQDSDIITEGILKINLESFKKQIDQLREVRANFSKVVFQDLFIKRKHVARITNQKIIETLKPNYNVVNGIVLYEIEKAMFFPRVTLILELIKKASIILKEKFSESKWHVIRKEFMSLLANSNEYGDVTCSEGGDPDYQATAWKPVFEWFGSAYVNDDKIIITKVGDFIKKDTDMNKLLLEQLIKFQYPNYSQEIHSIYFQPLYVILSIIEEFDYLDEDELILFVLGINDNDLEVVFENISKYRTLKEKEKMDIIKLCKYYKKVIQRGTSYISSFLKQTGIFDDKNKRLVLTTEGKNQIRTILNSIPAINIFNSKKDWFDFYGNKL